MAYLITIASADGFELLFGIIIIVISIISQLVSAKRKKEKNVIITSTDRREPVSPDVEIRKFLESLGNQVANSGKTEITAVEEEKTEELTHQTTEEEKATQFYSKAESQRTNKSKRKKHHSTVKESVVLETEGMTQSDIFQRSFTNIVPENEATEPALSSDTQPKQYLHLSEATTGRKNITVTSLFPAIREKKSEKRTLFLQKAFLMHEVFGPPIGLRSGNDLYSVPGIKNPHAI